MDRASQSGSTETTRPPPLTVITIRLRRRLGDAAPPPPPPSAASGTTPASGLSSGGVVVVEGVPAPTPTPPPAPATTTDPGVSASDGVVGGEIPTPHRPPTSTVLSICTAPRLMSSAAGDVDAEGVSPHSIATSETTTARTAPLPDVSEDDSAAEGQSLPPPLPLTDTIRTSTHLLGSEDGADQLGPSADSWTGLLPELLIDISVRCRPSRQDLESMRAVCTSWQGVIPSTIDPVLVLSREHPDVDSQVFLLEISRSKNVEDAVFKKKDLLSRPPAGKSCWGSALGLLAMRSHHPPDSNGIFVYCIHCGSSKTMLNLPEGATPKGLFLETNAPVRFVLMDVEANGEAVLRIDGTDFNWEMEGEPSWLPSPGFDDEQLKSIALCAGVLRAAVSNESVVTIDESGRPLDAHDEMIALTVPPLFENNQPANPWDTNGQHLFVCEGKVYYTEIYDSILAPNGVGVRLFLLEKLGEGDYTLVKVNRIGPFSLYLGVNQAFVVPAGEPFIGRLGNTLYVEDLRLGSRWPRVIAINFDNLMSFTIPYPHDVAAMLPDLLTAAWVGLPTNKDLSNHCKSEENWSRWDWL